MRVIETTLPGVLLLEPKVFGDSRGFFFEAWKRETFSTHGFDPVFVQGNVSGSACGVLRGLHYQWPTNPQGKLVSVVSGEVFDVAVDMRRGSPHFGRWFGEFLSADNHRGMWIPPGFAHGFLVLSEMATFTYLVTAPYDPAAEVSVRWDDPDIGIQWPPGTTPVLSGKDAAAPLLRYIPAERLPDFSTCARC
jgi:dTDP-4-dehydrorhamnose 3,5-epimerase